MKKIYSYLLLAVATLSLAACSSSGDCVEKTQLAAPALVEGARTVSSLAFSWQAVDGATQYAYELYSPSGDVVLGGVTNTTSVLATGLDDNTSYTLKVWAYGPAYGDKETSPIAELTATTSEIVPLANPEPTADGGQGSVTITWPEVEHAASYSYTYLTLAGDTVSGSTTGNSVTLRDLETGDYTLYVKAISGEEAYSNSEAIAVTFHFDNKYELWRSTGNYYSASLDKSFEADIVAYSDGSYTIEAPYGDKDYDISFTVKEGSTEIVPTNTAGADGSYYYIYVNSQWDYLYAYFTGGYSAFEEGSGKDKGELWFGNYLYSYSGTAYGSWGYDDFTWGSEEGGGMTVDDLVGSYSATDTGSSYMSYTSWEDVNQTETVTITKTGDNTITIANLLDWGTGVQLTATVDLSAMTVTIDKNDSWLYFTFCKYGSPDEGVVGTISEDGDITIEGYSAYYPGYDGYYLKDMKTVLKKITE